MNIPKTTSGCAGMDKLVRSVVFLATFLAVLTSCAAPRKTCPVVVPPKVSIDSPIAVLGFKGPASYSRELAGKFESMLVNSRWKGKNVYEVVDRQHIDKVVNEIKMTGGSWLFDPEKAARAGKLAGARTVIVGEISRADVEDVYSKKEQKKCMKWKKGASELEIVLGLGCEQWKSYFIPCMSRKGYFSFKYKVIDVATSKVVHSEVIENTSGETEQCNPDRPIRGDATSGDTSADNLRNMFGGDNQGKLQDKTAAVKEAMSKGLKTLAGNISVHSMDAVVKTDSQVEACKEALNLGSAYITPEVQLWDKACPLWEAAYRKFPNAYELAYNLGLCSEIKGNYKEAMYYYQTAYENMTGVDEDVVGARQRVMSVLKKQM